MSSITCSSPLYATMSATNPDAGADGLLSITRVM
eukprot:CAMPEP_0175972054 /NCGR_PEP_ID=MMETSP0108-20121206/42009_1 /TAXON_ID=195067 ORGANISM="Goniomonas pacifica, Strain CCMP1869" /NCGR_SAMPLE_ID=MMETSP0108 /ASSEMBLY_ACC=CAM_ASM_000204 /LENGTH=33 /DNA_ID= /DNA_START= /DNA_END= /DNA_ORIENTATION=